MLQRFSSWRMLHALVRPNPSYAVKSLVGSRLVAQSVKGLSTLKKIALATAARKVDKSATNSTKLSVPATSNKHGSNSLGSVLAKKYADGYVYEGGWHEGEWAGNGKLTSAAGQVWEGEFKKGKIFNGTGTIVFPDGDVYEGKWMNGMMEGKGQWLQANGSFLKGEFKSDNFYNGVGMLVQTDGTVSKGTWVEGRLDGELTKHNNLLEASDDYEEVVNPDGSELRGEFKGQMIYNGSGKMFLSGGYSVDGTWVKGKLQGQAKVTYPNGNIYIGEVVTAKGIIMRDGYGAMTYSSGGVYKGMWENDNWHGKGNLTNTDGTVLEGEWRGDRIYNGSGVLLHLDGQAVKATWVEGKMESQVELTYPGGNSYIGEVVVELNGSLRRHGFGVMTYSAGEVYEGMWEKNKRHGKGKLTNPDGTVAEGEWREGKIYNVNGVLDIGNRNMVEGTWVEGKLQGQAKVTYPGGNSYIGEVGIVSGIITQDGYGVMTYSSGGVYKGMWIKNKRHGKGKLTNPDGTVLEGAWKEDKIYVDG